RTRITTACGRRYRLLPTGAKRRAAHGAGGRSRGTGTAVGGRRAGEAGRPDRRAREKRAGRRCSSRRQPAAGGQKSGGVEAHGQTTKRVPLHGAALLLRPVGAGTTAF